MRQGESGSRRLTDEQLLEETVNHLKSLEGMDSVEWVCQGPYYTFQALVRISTSQGEVIRVGVSYVEDEEEQEMFDESFPPNSTG